MYVCIYIYMYIHEEREREREREREMRVRWPGAHRMHNMCGVYEMFDTAITPPTRSRGSRRRGDVR